MITNLKQAKSHLSELVEKAACGEEVVITVRGRPRARLCRVQPQQKESPLEGWAERLQEARSRYGRKKHAHGSQELWDELRDDRK